MKIVYAAVASFVVLIVFVPFWLSSKFESYSHASRELRYSSLAMDSVALRTNLRFQSRVKVYRPDDKRRFWHQSDIACMSTTRALEDLANGRRSKMPWPSGEIPGCADFLKTEKGSSVKQGAEPGSCRPVLVARNFPIQSGYNMSLVSVEQSGSKIWPELETGFLSETDQNYVEEQQLSKRDSSNQVRFINNGGFNSVAVKPTGVEKCNGFEIRRFDIKITNMDRLVQTIPVGLK